MVSEAEKYKSEDDVVKKRIEAKNGLENYCFQMKNTLNEEKLKEKFTSEDKSTIESVSKEGLDWLEANQNASAEEIEAKQKELESKFNPIMMRVYQASGGAPGGPGDESRGHAEGAQSYGQTSGVDDLD